MAAGQSSSSRADSVSRWGRASIICALGVSAALCGCSSGGELPERALDEGPPEPPAPGVLRLPFLVDDYFVPNGCFGDANCGEQVLSISSRACADRTSTSQSVCRRYRYAPLPAGTPGSVGYLGILFQDVGPGETGEIGRVPPLPVEPGARRLVFWAAVGSGSVEVGFRAGGANNWEGETDPNLPYRDEFGVGQLETLGTEFRQIEIDLTDVSYEQVVSPFGWSIEADGTTDAIDLFIDDVRWE